MATEIRITHDDAVGLTVETSLPPVVTLGLIELAKNVIFQKLGEPVQEQPKIVTPTPAAIQLVK